MNRKFKMDVYPTLWNLQEMDDVWADVLMSHPY